MVNPFIKTEAPIAADVRDLEFGKNRRIKGKGAIEAARTEVNKAKELLLESKDHLESLPKNHTRLRADAAKIVEEAGRDFTQSANQLGFAEGKLVPSVKGAVKAMGETLGFDTSNIGAGPIKGDVAETVAKAYETRANVFERLVSKPFRVAVKYPKMAIAATALAVGTGVAAIFKGRAEKRTQREVEAQMMEGQAQIIAAQSAQPSYMNSASQADVDARIAADRAAGVAPAGQAAAVNAARQQVPNPEAAARA